jgi:hypothetical protein
MLHNISHQVLPPRQNQCPMGKNLQLLAESHGVHPRGIGQVARIHTCLPTPWNGKLAHALELLQWVNTHVKGPH